MMKKALAEVKFSTLKILEDTQNCLVQDLQSIVAAGAGLAASSKKDVSLSVGRVLQATISGELLFQLMEEWSTLVNKGRIPSGYQESDQNKSLLSDLLGYLSQDIPDKRVFNLLKKIFLVAATETKSKKNDVYVGMYTKIAKKLSPEAILTMWACYQLLGSLPSNKMSYDVWISQVTIKSGLRDTEITELCVNELQEVKLLMGKVKESVGGFVLNVERAGLTRLGLNLCEYIKDYDDI